MSPFEEALESIGSDRKRFDKAVGELRERIRKAGGDPGEGEPALRAELLPFFCVALERRVLFSVEWTPGVMLELRPEEKIALEAVYPPDPLKAPPGSLLSLLGEKGARDELFGILAGKTYRELAGELLAAKGRALDEVCDGIKNRAIGKQLAALPPLGEAAFPAVLAEAEVDRETVGKAAAPLLELFRGEGYDVGEGDLLPLFLPWAHAKVRPFESAGQKHPRLEQGNLGNLAFFLLTLEMNREDMDGRTFAALEKAYWHLSGGKGIRATFGDEAVDRAGEEITAAANYLKSENVGH